MKATADFPDRPSSHSPRPHVVLVGVGALGSHVLLMGRNLPVSWMVIDFDRVEQRNMLSQFHARQSVGKNKAVALHDLVQSLFGLRIEGNPHRLTADNAAVLLGRAALVIDCVDDGDTRRLIQKVCLTGAIPSIHGALAADGALGRAVWTERFVADDAAPGAVTCEGGEHLPFVALVAARIVLLVREFLATGRKLDAPVILL